MGSGGGFIPRIMTQPRVDLHDSQIFEGDRDYNWGDIGVTFLVDADNGVGGNIDWENGSFFRENILSKSYFDTTTELHIIIFS